MLANFSNLEQYPILQITHLSSKEGSLKKKKKINAYEDKCVIIRCEFTGNKTQK
jgi:hypothetical protein